MPNYIRGRVLRWTVREVKCPEAEEPDQYDICAELAGSDPYTWTQLEEAVYSADTYTWPQLKDALNNKDQLLWIQAEGNLANAVRRLLDASNPTYPRPSRTYKNGIGKPVVAKIQDPVLGYHTWQVVFPPRNNFGNWTLQPEAELCGHAWAWCLQMNTP